MHHSSRAARLLGRTKTAISKLCATLGADNPLTLLDSTSASRHVHCLFTVPEDHRYPRETATSGQPTRATAICHLSLPEHKPGVSLQQTPLADGAAPMSMSIGPSSRRGRDLNLSKRSAIVNISLCSAVQRDAAVDDDASGTSSRGVFARQPPTARQERMFTTQQVLHYCSTLLTAHTFPDVLSTHAKLPQQHRIMLLMFA